MILSRLCRLCQHCWFSLRTKIPWISLCRIMELFILNYTWFVLHYIFRYLGVNPCEKDEFGKLKPTSACRYWMRFVCTNILVLVIFTGSFLYQVFVETSPEEFIKEYRKTLATSTTTIIVLILFNMLFFKKGH